MPVDLDGAELDPADLPAEALAAYAGALEAHGGRAGWLTFCGAPAEADCGHVDVYGSHVRSRPPLRVPAGPAVAA